MATLRKPFILVEGVGIESLQDKRQWRIVAEDHVETNRSSWRMKTVVEYSVGADALGVCCWTQATGALAEVIRIRALSIWAELQLHERIKIENAPRFAPDRKPGSEHLV